MLVVGLWPPVREASLPETHRQLLEPEGRIRAPAEAGRCRESATDASGYLALVDGIDRWTAPSSIPSVATNATIMPGPRRTTLPASTFPAYREL